MKCKYINMIAYLLVVIGALNWGLWGFFQFDLVAFISGGNYTWLARTIYSIVGLAGLWGVFHIRKCCCKKCSCSSGSCKDSRK
jgi:uncharacterized membrane protein YuzA (DUF378 family)